MAKIKSVKIPYDPKLVFFRFLKNEDMFLAYIDNHKKYALPSFTYTSGIKLFIENTKPQQWIRSCFSWSRTKQGFVFWESMAKKWENVLNA